MDLSEEDLTHNDFCHTHHLSPPTSSPNLTNTLQELDLAAANYTNTVQKYLPMCCRSPNFQVPKFSCAEFIQVEMEPVSKLLSTEEKLAIFLYLTGHNNSNKLA